MSRFLRESFQLERSTGCARRLHRKVVAALEQVVHRRGRNWSVTNLLDSSVWDLKEFVRLSRQPDVKWMERCQADKVGTVVVLTDAPWLSEVDLKHGQPLLPAGVMA